MRNTTILPLWGARLLTALVLCITLWALWNTTARGAAATPGQQASAHMARSGDRPQPEGDRSHWEGAQAASDSDKTSLHSITPEDLIASLYILILAGFVGFEVICGVSPLLHTPLMSVTNAISAISIVGALVVAGSRKYVFDDSGNVDYVSCILGLLAVLAASINVVGGFMITDRMLRMFKAREAHR
jgi:H+-translocating NAD(P) transhydrogenase subunit alpha